MVINPKSWHGTVQRCHITNSDRPQNTHTAFSRESGDRGFEDDSEGCQRDGQHPLLNITLSSL